MQDVLIGRCVHLDEIAKIITQISPVKARSSSVRPPEQLSELSTLQPSPCAAPLVRRTGDHRSVLSWDCRTAHVVAEGQGLLQGPASVAQEITGERADFVKTPSGFRHKNLRAPGSISKGDAKPNLNTYAFHVIQVTK